MPARVSRIFAKLTPPHRDWIMICALLGLGYLAVFLSDAGILSAKVVTDCLINVISLYLLGIASFPLLRPILSLPNQALQFASLAVFSIAFTLIWYVLITSLHGWVDAGFVAGGMIIPFSGPAFRWQMFQGIVIALLLIILVRATHRLAEAKGGSQDTEGIAASDTPKALLLRDDDQIARVELEDIVAIRSVDDEMKVFTATRSFPTRRSLKELSEQLPESFVRIHRSAIINLDQLVSVEPAGGGRMTVHLNDGSSLNTSRSGARLIRSYAM
ncbi:LytTR family DNA-binding domain-containing protein [Aurantiacibacter sediminis]|nr:LytTR family DNA-binding domain-containing protein [Aurantiacibacter sediminis]